VDWNPTSGFAKISKATLLDATFADHAPPKVIAAPATTLKALSHATTITPSVESTQFVSGLVLPFAVHLFVELVVLSETPKILDPGCFGVMPTEPTVLPPVVMVLATAPA
jgi:hypothetical protein